MNEKTTPKAIKARKNRYRLSGFYLPPSLGEKFFNLIDGKGTKPKDEAVQAIFDYCEKNKHLITSK